MKPSIAFCKRICIAFWTLAVVLAPLAAPAAPGTAAIVGRVLDAQGGLPVDGATVELYRNSNVVATTRTDATGTYRFVNQPPGTYSVVIRANGYQSARGAEFAVAPGRTEVRFQTAVNRQPGGLKEIAYVATAGRTALQTSSTINTHVDTDLLQSENFPTAGRRAHDRSGGHDVYELVGR